MQKIREFLKKLNTPLAYGISFIVIGLAFVFLPPVILDIPIAILGALIFLFGLCNIIFIGREATVDPIVGILGGGTILKSLIQMFFGISLIVVRSGVGESVCDALGVVIMLYAGFKLFRVSLRASYYGRSFNLEMILWTLLLAAGLFVLIFPLYPRITAGAGLIVVGIKLLVDALRVRGGSGGSRAGKRGESSGSLNTGDYYTDDFVDKSDK